MTVADAGPQTAAMRLPLNAPANPRLRDAAAAVLAASAVAAVLLALAPKLAWWILAILWLMVAARVYQGLAKRRRADARAAGRGPERQSQ